jgi:spermidine/putrescine transport system permease protein
MAVINWVRKHVVAVVAVLVFAFLLLPNIVVIWMSFNKPLGKFNYQWHKFSFDAWTNPLDDGVLTHPLVLALEIGLLATLVATILGTMIAFAIVRHSFKGRGFLNSLLFLPMAAPEIVMGSSMLTLFLNTMGVDFLGFKSILIAHIMFCLSYVVITVKSRLNGMDPMLEKAAQDLYATPWQTFWRVTFPLVAPGIGAAALLSFALSIDDFIITEFTAGNSVTFPVWIWGALQRGIPPQVNVIGSMMLIVTLAGIAFAEAPKWLKGRRQSA